MKTMDKESMLKSLATVGFNIGFGAKKHFATFDMVEKLPGIISILVIFIGIGQLAYPHNPYNTGISTVLILVSILTLSMSIYNSKRYEEVGKELTGLFNEVRELYFQVKDSDKDNYAVEFQEMKRIENQFIEKSISKQIFGSDWFAHYKFFFQMQIEWIKEGKNLTFWKDYIPKSFVVFIIIFFLFCWGWYYVFVRSGS